MQIGRKIPYLKHKVNIFTKINKKYFQGKKDEILIMLVNDCVKGEDFGFVHRAILHLNYNRDLVNNVMVEWGSKVREGERDLLVTRFIIGLANKENPAE